MKLRKVTKSEPLERLSVSVHASTAEALKQYQAFYKANTGDEIPMGLMVEEMLKSFMAKDRAFQKFAGTGTSN